MARDVFISYSLADKACAFELVARLEASGIQCWIAPRDIAPSADWAAEIIEAISAARVMILVFSASSNESPQVRREVERAVHKNVSILPFRIEDVLPSKSLEYFLSAQHWLDAFPPPREPHYDRLCTYLMAQLAMIANHHPAGAPIDAANPVTNRPAASAAPEGRRTPDTQHAAFDADALRYIERQLAGYIGPLAKHLVKTAVARASHIDDLVSRLAAELDAEPDQREFARRCREQIPRAGRD